MVISENSKKISIKLIKPFLVRTLLKNIAISYNISVKNMNVLPVIRIY